MLWGICFRPKFQDRRKKLVCDHVDNKEAATSVCMEGRWEANLLGGRGKDVWEKGQHPLQSEGPCDTSHCRKAPMVLSNWLSATLLSEGPAKLGLVELPRIAIGALDSFGLFSGQLPEGPDPISMLKEA